MTTLKLRNAIRRRVCGPGARDLLPGEKHAPCQNFTGPGTELDGLVPNDPRRRRVRDFPPYPGGIDACSREHDLLYEKAFAMTDLQARARAVRSADEVAIACYGRHKSDPA